MVPNFQLLFPSDPFAPKQADEVYESEYAAARAAGRTAALYSHEDLMGGELKVRGALQEGVPVLLRGWMLTAAQYAVFAQRLSDRNVPVLTSPEQYQRCHQLSGWYEQLISHTPDTVFVSEGADYVQAVADKVWKGYFVKDHVKSLSTGRGSACVHASDIAAIVEDIRRYRGHIEGGVAIRELEAFLPDTEERYFVFQGRGFAREGLVPPLVQAIGREIQNSFFSIDTVMRQDGQLRVVELGDGQVSDRKRWKVDAFMRIFA